MPASVLDYKLVDLGADTLDTANYNANAVEAWIANAMRFAEATERVAAALGRAAAALGRMRDGHPIGQAIIDGFIAGLHDARPRRVRPPRRAARRAHARRVAKRH